MKSKHIIESHIIDTEPPASRSNLSPGTQYMEDTRPLCQGMPFILTDAAHPRQVLKHGSHFIILDESGEIPACNSLGYGYYRFDTRHISQWQMLLDGVPMSLLSSTTSQGYQGTFLHTNVQTDTMMQQKIILQRDLVLGDALWERICIESFLGETTKSTLTLLFHSDFADMFEVRGLNRPTRGQRMLPVMSADNKTLFLAYKGQDGLLLETVIDFRGVVPTHVREGELTFELTLEPRQKQEIVVCVRTIWDGHLITADGAQPNFETAKQTADRKYKEWFGKGAAIRTEHELFDVGLLRGLKDLYILRQPTPKGVGLSAGVPWYSAVFGRDSVITSMQFLPFRPDIARETLEVLAAYQGKTEDDYRAESPGRIMHEVRFGELARINMIPHSPYYGTVDATQLWIVLLRDYISWSGDLEFAKSLWPHAQLAMEWIDRSSKTGYLTYKRISEKGLDNQGWKDSHDSVLFSSGVYANPPIAICEAQGYVYAAKLALAELADLLGHNLTADTLRQDAKDLKQRFQKDFWMDEHNFCALAIDGDGKKVDLLTSNPGHLLLCGILDEAKANVIADRLMNSDFWSGWGIRTVSSSSIPYNPISYHNGSIWPHDNSMIAAGLRKLGRVEDAHMVMEALYEVSQSERYHRLPELFCGFGKTEADSPIDYPVSCSPQAWAAGSMFQLLSACFNLQPDAVRNRLIIVEPSIPEWLGRVTVRNLKVGDCSLDLSFQNKSGITSCEVLSKSKNLRVILES